MAAMLSMPALLAAAGIALWTVRGPHVWRWTPVPARVGTAASSGMDAPIAILRERFARGEIDASTFEERVAHLLWMDREAQK